jgi:Icc-related predicted phosphoesterase
MTITALSDIHAAYDVLDRIAEKEHESDLLLLAGDISTFGTPVEIAAVMKNLIAKGKTILAVAGNMDMPPCDDELLRLGISLNARGVRIGDVGIFGVSAAPISILRTPYEITEEEIEQIINAGYTMVNDAPVKIFVPHSPPYNTKLDRIMAGSHVGSTAIRNFIERYQPDVVICGHIHEARGQDTLGKTRMVNCGPAHRGYYVHIKIAETITIENRELDPK